MLKKQLRLAPKTWFLKRMRVYWISHILYLFFLGGGTGTKFSWTWLHVKKEVIYCKIEKIQYLSHTLHKIQIKYISFFMTRVSYIFQDSRKIPSTVLKLAYRYIFITVYQFFTQLIGMLCPITFNICKYDKIHEIVCKNKQNLVKNM